MATKPLSIALGAKQQAILQRQLESGRYDNASEVIDDALQLMGERDAVFDQWLREDVLAAVADKRPPIPAETVFKRLEARHTKRMKAAKRGK